MGNSDKNTEKENIFISPVRAAFVRLLPTAWHNHISLRFEVLGCNGNYYTYHYEFAQTGTYANIQGEQKI